MWVSNYSHELRGIFNCRESETAQSTLLTALLTLPCLSYCNYGHLGQSPQLNQPSHLIALPSTTQTSNAWERESERKRNRERERGEYTFYYLHRHTYKHFFNKEITCSSSSSASSSASVGAFASSSTCLASRVRRICLRFLITRSNRANALKQTGQFPLNFLPKIPLFL